MLQIAVAGNIGSGKTTLTKMLAEKLGWKSHFEGLDLNPYINDFYRDMLRWSFNLQIYFLQSRLKQIVDIRKGKENVIQDRTIYEDAFIFAPNLYQMGLMHERDYQSYLDLFNISTSLVQSPDLLIYIKASVETLVKQIDNRGREYEKGINLEYLRNLNEHYETWIKGYHIGKVLVIDIDELNFLESDDDFGKVLQQVRQKLSLEPV
jgi:deoxyadenosine/deoxycytidine kinase